MTAPKTLTEQFAFLHRINALEAAGQHREAIELCEATIDGTELPEVQLALSRNRFTLAAGGDESLIRPALEAALAGIAKRHSTQGDLVHAVNICRWAAERLVDPPPIREPIPEPPPDPNVELLARIGNLEEAKQHQEAIDLCESAISSADGNEPPEVHLALARNAFSLAASGNETFAWPALFASLDGIEKRHAEQGDLVHAVGICRWVLDLFSDPHRLDVLAFTERAATHNPNSDELAAMYARGDYVRVCDSLLAAAPTIIRLGRTSGGVAREAAYLMATLHTMIDGSKVAKFLSTADFPLSGDFNGQPYDHYLLTAAQIHRQRRRVHGVPSILFAALPKSASEFLSYTLSEVLGTPVVRVTIGDPIRGTVYAEWLVNAAQGGCVLHDHFAATAMNLAALRAARVERLAVLVRDPRAAFWSGAVMKAEHDRAPPPTQDEATICTGVKLFADWIASWVQAHKAGFAVEFIRFRELTADPETVMGNLLDASGASAFRPRLQEVLRERAARPKISSNFRKGDDDAWRTHISPDLHAAIWELIPVEVRELLDLKP